MPETTHYHAASGPTQLLIGRGLCDRGPFAATLLIVLIFMVFTAISMILIMLSLTGPGPGVHEDHLTRLMVSGILLLVLAAWVMVAQTVRRIRSTGRTWLYLPLLLSAAVPFLHVPLGIALCIWPEDPSVTKGGCPPVMTGWSGSLSGAC
jgi:uncharacterized membrane protein YhaH (DUF805 family)